MTTSPQKQCCGTCLYRSHIRMMEVGHEYNWCECKAPIDGEQGVADAHKKILNGLKGEFYYSHKPMGVHSGTNCKVWKDCLT